MVHIKDAEEGDDQKNSKKVKFLGPQNRRILELIGIPSPFALSMISLKSYSDFNSSYISLY